MTNGSNVSVPIAATLDQAVRLLSASWPWLVLWAASEALFLTMAPEIAPLWVDVMAWLIRLYVFAAWLAAMYRAAGLGAADASPRSDMFRVWLASLLVCMAFALAAFFLFLFLMIFSLILVAVSGYDPTLGDPTDPSDSIEVLRSSGTIWILYGLGLVGLGGLGWMALRLMTYAAATVDRGKIRIFQTWGWTRGLWRQLAPQAVMVVGLPLLLGTVLAPWLAGQLGQGDALTAAILHVVFSGTAVLFWTALAVQLYPQVAQDGPVPDAG